MLTRSARDAWHNRIIVEQGQEIACTRTLVETPLSNATVTNRVANQ
jgi:hypothetical protein